MNKPSISPLPASLAELEASWPQLLVEIIISSRSPAHPNDLLAAVRNDSSFMALIQGWEKMPTTAQGRAWVMIQERLWEMVLATRAYCLRCGECCRRGSPALFDQDRPSLAEGVINRRDLVTLRRGEKAFSNQAQIVMALDHEQVKLKEVPESRACIFLSPTGDACLVYSDRPFMCRVMECWDPSRYKTLINRPPLTRLDLLGEDNPLGQLIKHHEERASVIEFADILTRLDPNDFSAPDRAREIVLFDLHVREFAQERLGLALDELDFFFGRPLASLVLGFGFSLEAETSEELIFKRLTPAAEI